MDHHVVVAMEADHEVAVHEVVHAAVADLEVEAEDVAVNKFYFTTF